MRPETRTAMEMLFCAKWNGPQAAKHGNLTRKEMMITFNEDCALQAPTYLKVDNAIQLRLNYDNS